MIKKIVYTFSIVIFILTGLELGVRLLINDGIWKRRMSSDLWQADEEIGWTNKSNFSNIFIPILGAVPIIWKTDSNGFQVTNETLDKNQYKILLIGDSTVAGSGVEEKDRLHWQILNYLKLGDPSANALIINAGVDGYSTDQEYALLERYVNLIKPTHILYIYCSNDIDPLNSSDLSGGLRKLRFLDKGDYLEKIPAGTVNLQSNAGGGVLSLIYQSAFIRLSAVLLKSSFSIEKAQQAKLFPIQDLSKIDISLYEKILINMRDLALRGNARFIMYSHPNPQEIYGSIINDNPFLLENALINIANRNGIDFVPMINLFRSNINEGPFQISEFDPHLNSNGYRIQAQELVRVIIAD